MKKYYVYIILTRDNTLYCGYTDDIEKRYAAHLSGHGAKYTRAHKPEKLVYVAEFETKQEAMREEYRIKKLSRREKEKILKTPL